MNNFINKKILPPVMKLVNTRPMQALKDGMVFPLPFIIVGSIFLILAQFPFAPVADFFQSIGLTAFFNQAYGGTFAIMALFAAFGIAYSWVKHAGYEATTAGMLAITVDIILQPSVLTTVSSALNPAETSTAWQATNVINKAWLGGEGMILAIISGLLVGWMYTWFMKKEITIKMPDSVPANVSGSFTALIPAFAIVTTAMIIYGVSMLIGQVSFVELIYGLIQQPLQHATDGIVGVLLISFLPVFFWFFGVHGATLISGLMMPLMLANSADNLKLYQAGNLSMDGGAHIVTQSFMDQFTTVTGSGMTIGLLIFMLIGAKSEQMKSMGKLSLGPAIFNINEPILFGTPIVLNPLFLVPFIMMPVAAGLGTYGLISLNILPPLNGLMVPWTTPVIISGFLVGGWQHALWQAALIGILTLMYWNFAKKYDHTLVAQQENKAA